MCISKNRGVNSSNSATTAVTEFNCVNWIQFMGALEVKWILILSTVFLYFKIICSYMRKLHM